jgi:hypothetical protein
MGYFDFVPGTTGVNGSVMLRWNFAPAPIPEPSTIALVSLVGVGVAGSFSSWGRRRQVRRIRSTVCRRRARVGCH